MTALMEMFILLLILLMLWLAPWWVSAVFLLAAAPWWVSMPILSFVGLVKLAAFEKGGGGEKRRKELDEFYRAHGEEPPAKD